MLRIIENQESTAWKKYVANHPGANAYHCAEWLTIIFRAYRHKTYNLAAVRKDPSSSLSDGRIAGLLPLVHLKNPLFGNRLVSMPFVDHGGIIADDAECEAELIQAAVALGQRVKANRIELRHLHEPFSLQNGAKCQNISLPLNWSLRSHKVRLLLPLAGTSEEMMKGFKSKLRSQIKRPVKAGLTTAVGGLELLDDFYKVFSINMRDLGSPVHTKRLPQYVMEEFKKKARIVVVYESGQPIASALMIGFKDVMINPWASALRSHSKLSPNMLLYWTMLAYACDNGYRFFDFGRSTPDEGTYRFKTQWGAQPHPMYWYTIWLNPTKPINDINETSSESKKRAIATAVWQKLPIAISCLIGPYIRKHIDL